MDRSLYWSEAFAVGHEELDADHRSLIQAINAICSAYETRAELAHLRKLLSGLKNSVKEHFDRENEVLREIMAQRDENLRAAQGISFVVLNEHINVHQHTLTQLQSIVRVSQASRRPAMKKMCEELRAWFLEHAVKHDAHLKTVFQAM